MAGTMYDAAYAANIPANPSIVAGYLATSNTYHIWDENDWKKFKGVKKLPIWVAANGNKNGKQDAMAAQVQMYDLGVPNGVYMALDLETQVDVSYVESFGAYMNWVGFRVFVYGSASTVFGNPKLNGYWVADYAGVGPFMYNHSGVRLTQYASNNTFDSSSVKTWTALFGKWWK